MTDLKNINFQFKARYYSYGKLNKKTRYLFIAFHGYGQLASYFIRNFKGLGEEYFVIIPEGLHHFYLEGMSGRVGSSWMTKEDRQTDIENQSAYLNEILLNVEADLKQNIKLIVFGFSQGFATAMRWVVRNNINVDTLIDWAGSIPNDLKPSLVEDVLKESEMLLITGDSDPYINDKSIVKMESQLESYKLIPIKVTYEGDHRIFPTILNKIVAEKIS